MRQRKQREQGRKGRENILLINTALIETPSGGVLYAGSCARSRPVNLTSERGVIEISLTLSMSRSSSKSTVQFECHWLVRPSTVHTSVVLQFLSLRLFASGASPPNASVTKSTCSESFVEVHVGKNLVSRFSFLFLFHSVASSSIL